MTTLHDRLELGHDDIQRDRDGDPAEDARRRRGERVDDDQAEAVEVRQRGGAAVVTLHPACDVEF